jgi:hypothetical protein
MPTYIRPARVVVDEGSGHVAAIIAAIVLAVVVSGAAVLIADIVTALLIIAAIAVAGSLAVLVIVLRRTGLGVDQRPPPPARRAPVAIPVAERRAITPTRIVLHGEPMQPPRAVRDR